MAATKTNDSPTNDSPILEIEPTQRRFWASARYWLANWKLTIGVALIAILLIFSIVGSLTFLSNKRASALAISANRLRRLIRWARTT